MASITTNRGRKVIIDGTVDLLTDTLKCVLLGTGYTPNKDHNFFSDFGANELSGTGYVGGFNGSGRKVLASKTVPAQDDTNDLAYFDAADQTWTAINAGTIAYVGIGKEITNDAASLLIGVIDISPDVVTNGGDVTIQWGSSGLFSFASA